MPRAQSPEAERRRIQATVVGRLLAAARAAAGVSQAEAAARLGLAQTAVAKLEAGSRRLGLLEAIELAKLYQVNLHDLAPTSMPEGPSSES